MFSFHDIARELGAHLEFPQSGIPATSFSIDTRTLQPGDVFVALPGTQGDGHQFLQSAFEKGAAGAIVKSTFSLPEDPANRLRNLIPVESPEKALADLARAYRSAVKIPFIGVTGSVGKTTTKEFLHYLLSREHRVLATQGNFNNHLGLPLTLLKLTENHQYGLAELGANHVGEIRFLAGILQPSLAIITQISPAHLEGFGSLDNIYKAKSELLEELPRDGIAVIPDHDPVLWALAKQLPVKVIRVGRSASADYRVENAASRDGKVFFEINGKRFCFPGKAPFLSLNAGMALATYDCLGLDWSRVSEAWNDFSAPRGRFEALELPGGVDIIYDGYNASPTSFRFALEAFAQIPSRGRKIVVFADMLELGSDAVHFHQDLGEKIALIQADAAFAYGPLAKHAIEAASAENENLNARHFLNPGELEDFLCLFLHSGDTVLFKASRGMKMDLVVEHLRDKLAARLNPAAI